MVVGLFFVSFFNINRFLALDGCECLYNRHLSLLIQGDNFICHSLCPRLTPAAASAFVAQIPVIPCKLSEAVEAEIINRPRARSPEVWGSAEQLPLEALHATTPGCLRALHKILLQQNQQRIPKISVDNSLGTIETTIVRKSIPLFGFTF